MQMCVLPHRRVVLLSTVDPCPTLPLLPNPAAAATPRHACPTCMPPAAPPCLCPPTRRRPRPLQAQELAKDHMDTVLENQWVRKLVGILEADTM